MSDEKTLTAGRLDEIRERAEKDRRFFPSHADSRQRAEDILALLAAFEAAQAALAKAEGERDEALAEMRRAEGERREALARRKDALDSLATIASARDALVAERDAGVLERASLAARLAEVDAALAKTQKERDSARAALARLVEVYELEHDPSDGTWERPAWVTANLPGSEGPVVTPGEAEARALVAELEEALATARDDAFNRGLDEAAARVNSRIITHHEDPARDLDELADAIRAMSRAAPPEQAPRTDDGARAEVERLQMLMLDIRGLCTVVGGSLVTPRPERALETIRDLTYRAIPSSESTLCDARPADVGVGVRTCDTCRHHRSNAARRCGAGCGWAPADVGAAPEKIPAEINVKGARIHRLKIWPQFFVAVGSTVKPFEIRKADRDLQVGDYLHLQEWDPKTGQYSGRKCVRRVTYVAGPGGPFLPADTCVMGLTPVAGAGAFEIVDLDKLMPDVDFDPGAAPPASTATAPDLARFGDDQEKENDR